MEKKRRMEKVLLVVVLVLLAVVLGRLTMLPETASAETVGNDTNLSTITDNENEKTANVGISAVVRVTSQMTYFEAEDGACIGISNRLIKSSPEYQLYKRNSIYPGSVEFIPATITQEEGYIYFESENGSILAVSEQIGKSGNYPLCIKMGCFPIF